MKTSASCPALSCGTTSSIRYAHHPPPANSPVCWVPGTGLWPLGCCVASGVPFWSGCVCVCVCGGWLEIEIPNWRPGNQKCGFLDFATRPRSAAFFFAAAGVLLFDFWCGVCKKERKGNKGKQCDRFAYEYFSRPVVVKALLFGTFCKAVRKHCYRTTQLISLMHNAQAKSQRFGQTYSYS